MKKCNHCLKEKPEEEFNWRYKSLGIRHPTCRECQKPFRRQWYEGSAKEKHLENVRERKIRVREEAREYVWNYLLTHPCVSCGEGDPVVLTTDLERTKPSLRWWPEVIPFIRSRLRFINAM